MVTSLSDTLDSGLLSLTVIETGSERPSQEELEKIDSAVISRFGWAFRFGVGESNALNDFRYGYIIGGHTLNPETISSFENKLQEETQISDPSVLMKPVEVPEKEFESMEKIGKLPQEILKSLQDFTEEFTPRQSKS